MPMYPGGSLQTVIAEQGEYGLSEEHMIWVAANVVSGVDALHRLGFYRVARATTVKQKRRVCITPHTDEQHTRACI